MYYPPFDSPLFLREEMGTYAPRDHQRIISKLDFGLRWLYQKEKKITLEPLPETMVNDTEASPTPDLVLVDNEAKTLPVIIEVCTTSGLRNDIKKVINLLDNEVYGIVEGFVYNYKTEQWYRYRVGMGSVVEETSWSDVLQLDLNSLLQE